MPSSALPNAVAVAITILMISSIPTARGGSLVDSALSCPTPSNATIVLSSGSMAVLSDCQVSRNSSGDLKKILIVVPRSSTPDCIASTSSYSLLIFNSRFEVPIEIVSTGVGVDVDSLCNVVIRMTNVTIHIFSDDQNVRTDGEYHAMSVLIRRGMAHNVSLVAWDCDFQVAVSSIAGGGSVASVLSMIVDDRGRGCVNCSIFAQASDATNNNGRGLCAIARNGSGAWVASFIVRATSNESVTWDGCSTAVASASLSGPPLALRVIAESGINVFVLSYAQLPSASRGNSTILLLRQCHANASFSSYRVDEGVMPISANATNNFAAMVASVWCTGSCIVESVKLSVYHVSSVVVSANNTVAALLSLVVWGENASSCNMTRGDFRLVGVSNVSVFSGQGDIAVALTAFYAPPYRSDRVLTSTLNVATFTAVSTGYVSVESRGDVASLLSFVSYSGSQVVTDWTATAVEVAMVSVQAGGSIAAVTSMYHRTKLNAVNVFANLSRAQFVLRGCPNVTVRAALSWCIIGTIVKDEQNGMPINSSLHVDTLTAVMNGGSALSVFGFKYSAVFSIVTGSCISTRVSNASFVVTRVETIQVESWVSMAVVLSIVVAPVNGVFVCDGCAFTAEHVRFISVATAYAALLLSVFVGNTRTDGTFTAMNFTANNVSTVAIVASSQLAAIGGIVGGTNVSRLVCDRCFLIVQPAPNSPVQRLASSAINITALASAVAFGIVVDNGLVTGVFTNVSMIASDVGHVTVSATSSSAVVASVLVSPSPDGLLTCASCSFSLIGVDNLVVTATAAAAAVGSIVTGTEAHIQDTVFRAVSIATVSMRSSVVQSALAAVVASASLVASNATFELLNISTGISIQLSGSQSSPAAGGRLVCVCALCVGGHRVNLSALSISAVDLAGSIIIDSSATGNTIAAFSTVSTSTMFAGQLVSIRLMTSTVSLLNVTTMGPIAVFVAWVISGVGTSFGCVNCSVEHVLPSTTSSSTSTSNRTTSGIALMTLRAATIAAAYAIVGLNGSHIELQNTSVTTAVPKVTSSSTTLRLSAATCVAGGCLQQQDPGTLAATGSNNSIVTLHWVSMVVDINAALMAVALSIVSVLSSARSSLPLKLLDVVCRDVQLHVSGKQDTAYLLSLQHSVSPETSALDASFTMSNWSAVMTSTSGRVFVGSISTTPPPFGKIEHQWCNGQLTVSSDSASILVWPSSPPSLAIAIALSNVSMQSILLSTSGGASGSIRATTCLTTTNTNTTTTPNDDTLLLLLHHTAWNGCSTFGWRGRGMTMSLSPRYLTPNDLTLNGSHLHANEVRMYFPGSHANNLGVPLTDACGNAVGYVSQSHTSCGTQASSTLSHTVTGTRVVSASTLSQTVSGTRVVSASTLSQTVIGTRVVSSSTLSQTVSGTREVSASTLSQTISGTREVSASTLSQTDSGAQRWAVLSHQSTPSPSGSSSLLTADPPPFPTDAVATAATEVSSTAVVATSALSLLMLSEAVSSTDAVSLAALEAMSSCGGGSSSATTRSSSSSLLRYLLSPFADFGSTIAVAGNLAVVLLVLIIQRIVIVVLHKHEEITAATTMAVASDVRLAAICMYPHVWLVVATTLLPGSLRSAITVAVTANGAAATISAIVCATSVMICVGGVALTWSGVASWMARHGKFVAVDSPWTVIAVRRYRFPRCLLPRGEWRPRTARRCFGIVIGSVRGLPFRWWTGGLLVHQWLFTAATAIPVGSNHRGCAALYIALGVWSVVPAACAAYWQPYRLRAFNAVMLVNACLLSATAFLRAAELLEHGPLSSSSATLSSAITVLSVIQCTVTTLKCLWFIALRVIEWKVTPGRNSEKNPAANSSCVSASQGWVGATDGSADFHGSSPTTIVNHVKPPTVHSHERQLRFLVEAACASVTACR